MAKRDKTTRLLGSMKEKRTPLGSQVYLPNHSGDHVRSIKRLAPVDNKDLVNKEYVDLKADGIDPDHTHSKLAASDGTPDPSFSVDADGNVTAVGIIYADGNVGGLGLDVLRSAKVSINLDVGQNVHVEGNVGIGTDTPTAKLHVETTDTSTPNFINVKNNLTANPSSDTSNAKYNAHFLLTHSNANYVTNGKSFLAQTLLNNAGNAANIFSGFMARIGTQNNANAAKLTGGEFLLELEGSGTIADARALNILNLANNGTITNTYGLYIGDMTAGTQTNQAYSIYVSDANARNYIAGNVGIGTPTPGVLLDIESAVSPQLRLTDTTNSCRIKMLAVDLIAIFGTESNHSLFIKTNDITRIAIDNSGDVGVGTATPTIRLSVREKAGMTEIGGFAVKLTNKTGVNSVKGKLVKADTATNDAVILTAATDDECFGVFLDDGIADGAEAWVVLHGIIDVLFDDNVAAVRGNWVGTGAAGYARTQASPPALGIAAHFEELGHCIESVTNGGAGTHILARCILHFN